MLTGRLRFIPLSLPSPYCVTPPRPRLRSLRAMAVAAESTPLLGGKPPSIPPAPFTRSLARQDGSRMPQTIAHRGFRTAQPENSMAAFRAAVDIGAHALETDLHLSKDKVVVLSHDPTLKRCFGKDEKLADCEWSYLETLRTTKEPHVPLARLSDLLEYLAQPGNESIWLLLDVKVDDDPDELLRRTAETIAAAPVSKSWKDRIVVGCWNAKFMKISKRHLPDFPIAYIGFSLLFARSFLKEPNVHFNMFQKTLIGPLGQRFIADARAAGRSLWVWTVNEEEWMEWSIRKQVDGVITDDPKLFLDVCKRWEEEGAGAGGASNSGAARAVTTAKRQTSARRWAAMWWDVLYINVLATVFTFVFVYKHGWPARQVKRELQS